MVLRLQLLYSNALQPERLGAVSQHGTQLRVILLMTTQQYGQRESTTWNDAAPSLGWSVLLGADSEDIILVDDGHSETGTT